MKKKIIAAFLALLFVLFAAVQFNDPDSWKWILAYGSVAVLFVLLPFKIASKKVSKILLITFSCVAALYIPDFIEWINMGMPSISETMKAEKTYVEMMREFFGLLIMILALLFYPRLILNDDYLQSSESNLE